MPPSTTTCTSLLHELQIIWDEIGESYNERDKMLLELEQECLDIYNKKVEKTRKYRAELEQSLAYAEAQIAKLMSALGENVSFSRGEGSLKEKITTVKPVLEGLLVRKDLRRQELSETLTQIAEISFDITGSDHLVSFGPEIDESDLTQRKLDELRAYLQDLRNEKAVRLQKVNSYVSAVHELSEIMSLDYSKALGSIHGSLADLSKAHSKSISNDTLGRLTELIESLKEKKHERLLKLQGLGTTMQELWNLMEIPMDERRKFIHVSSLLHIPIDDSLENGCLAQEIVQEAEVEVKRLIALKSSKMKELVFKRQSELEEICRGVHMFIDSDAARQSLLNLIDSGDADLSNILASIDGQIEKAKEEALSRKEILDKVDKWRHAKEEEKWLDDYEKDENRFSAVRGAHKNLKRAEKARSLISKLPAMIDVLTTKVKVWEKERGVCFICDKLPLLQTLEEDIIQRAQREEEKRQFREQKRLQGQLATEKEAMYGTKSAKKKPLGQSLNTENVSKTPIGRSRTGTTPGRSALSGGNKEYKDNGKGNSVIPVNYVALQKED